MQYVNDDMDELFRRASEDYPLDTSTADWSKVVNALQNNDGKESKDSSRKYLWLLLLLPLGWICNQYGLQGNSGKEKTVAEEKVTNQNRNVSAKPSLEAIQYDQALQQPNNENGLVYTNESKLLVKKSNSLVIDSKANHSSLFENDKLKENNSVITNAFNLNEIASSELTENKTQNNPRIVSSIELLPVGNYQHGFAFLNGKSSVLSNKIKEDEPSKTIVSLKPHKRFYIGLETGIDATTVKFQKVKNAGSGYGLLLGYELNKKWSIETGIFRDKKLYYTEGQYFSKEKLYVPSNSDITDVNGDCKMYEIPVALKYNLPSKKSQWFVTAGVSSYFMKNEDYNYDYYYYNTGYTVTRYKSYTASTSSFFSVAQLTGGYSRHLGKIVDLRIEPYVKIPIKQVGIGKLPLLSAGLNVGITKKLF